MGSLPLLQTIDGYYFSFSEPQTSWFDIETIAHALSNVCRFAGHSKVFYSVAQHSVLVSELVPKEQALAGLLHDAAEAFIGDVPSPLKGLLHEYREIEKRVEGVIFRRFGLPLELSEEVKCADKIALATERRDLLVAGNGDVNAWDILDGVTPLQDRYISALLPQQAKAMFMSRYYKIVAEIR